MKFIWVHKIAKDEELKTREYIQVCNTSNINKISVDMIKEYTNRMTREFLYFVVV
jgi:hypothetical protein